MKPREHSNATQAEVNRAAADAHAESLRAIVTPLAGQPMRVIAAALNDAGIAAPRGGRWQATTVMRLLGRLNLLLTVKI